MNFRAPIKDDGCGRCNVVNDDVCMNFRAPIKDDGCGRCNVVDDDICMTCRAPIKVYGTEGCNINNDEMLMLRTPGGGSNGTGHGMENVSYSKYPSGMPVAKTHVPCLKTDGKGPDQPEYLKNSEKTTHGVGNSSIDTCMVSSAGTIHGITSKTVLVDNPVKSVRFNPNVQVNEYIVPQMNINEMSDKVKMDYLMGMRESVRKNVENPGTEEGFPYGNNIVTLKYLVNSVHRDIDTGLLYRVIDIYEDRQRRLAMCRRALILPDGNLSTVSIDEVCVTDILNYERIDNKDYALNARACCVIDSEVLEDCDQSLTNEMINILKGTYDLTDDCLTHFCLLVGESVTDIALPKTHKQAMLSPEAEEWRKAEEEELRCMRVNKVLKPCKLLGGVVPLTTKWVYTIKRDGKGNILKYKARLVARGYMQVMGIDYDETFSPVTRLETVRLVLAIAAQLCLKIHQMDVETAFLNADLEETEFIWPPDGVTIEEGFEVFQLKKALYGLKQAPRAWYKNIDLKLRQMGFKPMVNESCLYFRCFRGSLNVIALYVDDLIICGVTEAIDDVKRHLCNKYKMKDLGVINRILGCEVLYDDVAGTYSINQMKYVKDMCTKFLPKGSVAVKTPMNDVTLCNDMCPKSESEVALMKDVPYKAAIGCLLWLVAGTRMDIAYAVQTCARYSVNPGPLHWEAVLRIMKYLQGTAGYGIIYRRELNSSSRMNNWVIEQTLVSHPDTKFSAACDSLNLYAYVDADHGRDIDTRRSVTAYIFYLGGAPVSWKSKLQQCVATSSMQSEYMALCAACLQSLWMITILRGLGYNKLAPITLLEDNQSCIEYSKNNTAHDRTKHIEIKYHLVREQIQQENILVIKVPTKENIADLLTKPLYGDAFWQHMTGCLVLIHADVEL